MYQTNEYIDFPHHGLVSDFCPEQHAHPDNVLQFLGKQCHRKYQQIYAAARKKLADALVEGLPLRIERGDFVLCSGNSAAYGCRNCYQQKIHPMLSKHFIE